MISPSPHKAQRRAVLSAILLVPILMVLSTNVVTQASSIASFSPRLVATVNNIAPSDTLSVVLVLRDQLDISAKARQLEQQGVPLEERRKLLLGELRRFAAEHQQDLIKDLRAGSAAGQPIWNVKSHSIMNMVSLTTTANHLNSIAANAEVDRLDVCEGWQPDGSTRNVLAAQTADTNQCGNCESGHPDCPVASVSDPDWQHVRIKANRLWDEGLTGDGILFAIDDDRDPTACNDEIGCRWRGWDSTYEGHREWAWYRAGQSGSECDTIPTEDGGAAGKGDHGSQTVSVVCGANAGVAPDGEWIGLDLAPAGPSTLTLALDWAVNPDDDTSTTWDIPDGYHTWGTYLVDADEFAPCSTEAREAIANFEAIAGPICMSAGNHSFLTLTDPLNVPDGLNQTIAVGSAADIPVPMGLFTQGPSQCDFASKRPQMAAGGATILNYTAPGNPRRSSGTSFTSPQLLGALGLLRELDPNASGATLRNRIYLSAIDLVPYGEDNYSGHGYPDLEAAAAMDQDGESNPCLAVLPGGDYVVAWEDPSSSDRDVWFAIYDSTGSVQVSTTRVNPSDSTGVDHFSPAICADTAGNFVIAWIDNANGNNNIRFQRYNSSGTAQGTAVLVTSSNDCWVRERIAIACEADGDFIVVWQDHRTDASTPEIYKQSYEADGTAVGSNTAVNGASGAEDRGGVSVSCNESGQTVVCWQEADDPSGSYSLDDNPSEVWAKQYASPTGSAVGSAYKVSDEASFNNTGPGVSVEDNGFFVVTWWHGWSPIQQIVARQYDWDSGAVASSFTVASDTGLSAPGVTHDGDGHFTIYWTSMSDYQMIRQANYRRYVCGDSSLAQAMDPEPVKMSSDSWIQSFNPSVRISEGKMYCLWQEIHKTDSLPNDPTWENSLSSTVAKWEAYLPGDMDGSCAVDALDMNLLIDYLYYNGADPNPLNSGDINASCQIDSADLSDLIDYIFSGGDKPVPGCVE